MQTDLNGEWLRLAEHYRTLYDDELLNLAADSGDLTDAARQALATEMQNRGLKLPPAEVRRAPERRPINPATNDAVFEGADAFGSDVVPLSSGGQSHFAQIAGEGETPADADFTWKTVLCECETVDQARALQLVLAKAGIECWLETRREYPRVLVAADELDEARAIAAKPISQETLDELNQEVPEFEMEACPACHAPDPVLEDVEPTNQWLCESCGHRWSDPAE